MKRLVMVILCACIAVGANAAAAIAQADNGSPPSAPTVAPGVTLVSQTPWVGLRSQFSMKLHITDTESAALPTAAIALRIHDTTPSRSSFDDVIANRDLGAVISQPDTIPIAAIPQDADHNITLTFGLAGSGVRPTLPISRAGVYPVEVSLVGGAPSGSFVTWLVTVDSRSANPVEKKLSVAFVWQLVADPSTTRDGLPAPTVAAQMMPGGRLDRIATVLDRAEDFPVSVAVSPATVEEWNTLAKKDPSVAPGLARVRNAAARSTFDLMPTTYVPIDLSAFEHTGLGGYLVSQYAHGAQVLDHVLAVAPTTKAHSAFLDPASDSAVDALRGMLADRVVVRDGSLIPTTHRFTPSQTFVLDTATGRSRSAATAPFIEGMLDGTDPPALRAQRIVAALAEIAYETPSIARGVVIAPPAGWTPNVALMTALIDGLHNNPLVQPTALDEYFAQVTSEQINGFDAERRLAPKEPAQTPLSAGEYQAAVDQLSAYRDVVGPRDPIVQQGTHALLLALSTSITPEAARALFASTESAVTDFEHGITTDAKRVTLTSRRARVPLSFVNTLKPARAVQVRVHLDSPKLSFPDGADQLVTLKPGNNTIPFTVEARTSGTFPMTINVTSPNGQMEFGAPVRVTVRSAVFGHLAVALTIAAIVFLALWWANHVRRNRRGRRVATAAAPAT